MHFFNPVPVMKLVEIIPALQTDAEAVELATEMAKRLGKAPWPARTHRASWSTASSSPC